MLFSSRYDYNKKVAKRNLEFLRISSRLIKIAAWTFLLFGVLQAAAIFLKLDKSVSIGIGFVWLIVYACIFLFFYHVASMADLLLEIWQFLKKERF